MKKFFLFIMVALMSIMTLNAENTRIYCKMSQDWWKVDGAAVGCHSWGTGQGTDWPGVRMTPVEGEPDTWYIDLNTEDVQNVIFTRVNPSGAIADWGAKTKDLTIPVNGDNLFTITTSDESWGDPGCDGEWSVFGDNPGPGTSTYYLVGYINGADYGCEADIDNMGDYNLTAGPVVITFTEKSYVQVKNQNKSIYGTAYVDATEPGSTVLSVGATDKIGLPANVEITFTLTENADGTVTLAYTWGDTPTPPTPEENVYGITVNGTPVLGTKNESPLDPSFEEWQVLEQSLVTGDLVTLYNQNGGATWVVALDEASVEGIELNATGDAYIITQDGCYNFYIKLKFEADQLYVGSCGDTPTPADEGFGIILGDGSTIKGWKNEAQVDFLEYMIEADLTTSTMFQLYDFGNQAAWTVDNIDEASTPNVIINASNVYEVLADGHYTIYLKMYGMGNDQVYIAYEASTGLREAIINAPVKKVMVDGILYIVKDNKVYTAQGF